MATCGITGKYFLWVGHSRLHAEIFIKQQKMKLLILQMDGSNQSPVKYKCFTFFIDRKRDK